MVARLRKVVDNPAVLTTFSAKYNIPNEIGLELVKADDFPMEEMKKRMSFPAIAIVEGGLRFLLFPFLQ